MMANTLPRIPDKGTFQKLLPADAQKPVGLIPKGGGTNFMYALMKAVSKDQSSMSTQQIIDAKTTQNDAAIETALYGYWNQVLESIDAQIQMVNPNWDNSSQIMNKLQNEYNVNSAQGQSNESQEDGAVQAAQGQTSTDASNLQMKAQMIQSVNGILSALTNMLGQVIS